MAVVPAVWQPCLASISYSASSLREDDVVLHTLAYVRVVADAYDGEAEVRSDHDRGGHPFPCVLDDVGSVEEGKTYLEVGTILGRSSWDACVQAPNAIVVQG